MRCEYCNRQLVDDERVCPHCGAPVLSQKIKEDKPVAPDIKGTKNADDDDNEELTQAGKILKFIFLVIFIFLMLFNLSTVIWSKYWRIHLLGLLIYPCVFTAFFAIISEKFKSKK